MINVHRIGEHWLRKPEVTDEANAGIDIRTREAFSLLPGERRVVPTGFAWEFPTGIFGRISPRSGLGVKGIDVLAGIVDESYRGEVRAILINHGTEPVHFNIGDRVAQMVLALTLVPHAIEEVAELGETQRGDKGFGSSGLG